MHGSRLCVAPSPLLAAAISLGVTLCAVAVWAFYPGLFLDPGFLLASAIPLAVGVPVLFVMRTASRHGGATDRAEQERAHALLRSTLESTSDGILTVDLSGGILSHNQKFLEMWGLDAADLQGGDHALIARVLHRLVEPEEYILRIQTIYANAEAISSDDVELRDGRVFQRLSQPYRSGPAVVGRIWTFRDLTDQRRTEAALAASENRFRQVAANVPGVIFQFYVNRDNCLRYTYLSPGGKTLLGVEPDSFPWKADSLLERIHPEDLPALKAATARSASTMEPWNWEGRLALPEGSTKWLRAAARPTRDAQGRILWDGLLMDITEEKNAVEALHRSEERFRQMAESIGEVFFMVNVEPKEIIYLSPAYEEVWGRPRAEAMANSYAFIEAILPEDRPILFAEMELSRTGQGEPQRTFDYRISRPDGTIRWIRNRTFQIPDDEGKPYRVAGVCSDITAQKQMEEELQRSNRIEAIGHLAAGIAHEINTPIQYIGDNLRFLDESHAELRRAMEAYHGLLEEARAGLVPPQRIKEIAALMQVSDVDYLLREAPRASAQALDGVQRVAEIVSAMKEFSHPGTGQRIATDLNQSILSTTTVARNEWKYVAELVTRLDPSLPLVHCLPGELNQAILNLVVNAAHAIADRQQAEGSEELGVITVATALVGDCVEIRVGDTGIGIADGIRARIFDPFFTTKEVGRGTGQGLTFVHSIVVDKHRGSVSFETEPGVGTTFIARLPYRSESRDLGEAA